MEIVNQPPAIQFTQVQKNRREKIIPIISRDVKVLEIGPAMSPTLYKSEYNISFLDYINREDQRKYCQTEDDYLRVPETDILVTSDQYTAFVSECYDCIIANHVIEHVSDVIGFFTRIGNYAC